MCAMLDTDRDGIPDLHDNCPYIPNGPSLGTCLGNSGQTTCHANSDCVSGMCSLSQEDTGGIGIGSLPDGIGDACQCGDVNNDGIVSTGDLTILTRSLVNLSPYFSVGAMPGYAKCDVNGDGLCTTGDKTVLSRVLAGLGPGIQPKCPAAMSAVGGGPGNSQPTQCLSANMPNIPDLNAEGWLGGDIGASFVLPDGSSTLWLFGDSWIGHPNDTDRTNTIGFPSNSIGISTCPPQYWGAMDHYWAQFGTAPENFFNPTLPSSSYYDWPFEAFSYGSRVYVLMQRGTRQPFQGTGTDLAIISTLDPVGSWANPAEWTQQIISLNTSPSATLAATAVQPGDSYVYIYTALTGPLINPTDLTNPMILVRAPLGQLNDIVNQLQYFSMSQQSWQKVPVDGTTAWEKDAKVMFNGSSEMSVRWHDAQKEWIAVYIPYTSSQIVMLTAPSPQGPMGIAQQSLTWSSPQPIYPIPEMTASGDPNYQTNQCYAAQEHIEWATPTSMVVTYDCNNSLSTVKADINLYHPVPVLIPLQ
jgi:hypothetical protein